MRLIDVLWFLGMAAFIWQITIWIEGAMDLIWRLAGEQGRARKLDTQEG